MGSTGQSGERTVDSANDIELSSNALRRTVEGRTCLGIIQCPTVPSLHKNYAYCAARKVGEGSLDKSPVSSIVLWVNVKRRRRLGRRVLLATGSGSSSRPMSIINFPYCYRDQFTILEWRTWFISAAQKIPKFSPHSTDHRDEPEDGENRVNDVKN